MIFGTNLSTLSIGLMKCGRARWQGGGGNKKKIQCCTDPLTHQDKKFFTFRVLQGHSGSNPIDPSLQDNVLIPINFFEYIYHIGCAVNVHSITNSGLIVRGQKFKQETHRRYSLQP